MDTFPMPIESLLERKCAGTMRTHEPVAATAVIQTLISFILNV